MPSNAFSGVGTKFMRRVGSGSSSDDWTQMAEVNSITGPNKSKATIDVTSLDSVGGYREFITSFRDSGEVTLNMNFTLDSYDDMNADFESESSNDYQIILPDTGNTTFDFTGFVTSISMAVPLDDKVSSDVTIKITGAVTISS